MHFREMCMFADVSNNGIETCIPFSCSDLSDISSPHLQIVHCEIENI